MEDIMTVDEIQMQETVFDKIQGMTDELHQMERMIEENVRLIAEGDDVEGRTYLKAHLENEVANRKQQIAELKQQTEG